MLRCVYLAPEMRDIFVEGVILFGKERVEAVAYDVHLLVDKLSAEGKREYYYLLTEDELEMMGSGIALLEFHDKYPFRAPKEPIYKSCRRLIEDLLGVR
jgi:hypothetical protein